MKQLQVPYLSLQPSLQHNTLIQQTHETLARSSRQPAAETATQSQRSCTKSLHLPHLQHNHKTAASASLEPTTATATQYCNACIQQLHETVAHSTTATQSNDTQSYNAQAGRHNVPLSARSSTAVSTSSIIPVQLQKSHPVCSVFRQPTSAHSTSLSTQHLQLLSGFFDCQSV